MLNAAGMMVDQVCQEITSFMSGVALDHYQIMPNDFHGIIILNPIDFGNDHEPTVGVDLRVCPGQPQLKECYAKGCPYTESDRII